MVESRVGVDSIGAFQPRENLVHNSMIRRPYQGTPLTSVSPVHDEESANNVPEVYREHRDQYSSKPRDIVAFRKQMMYRCGRFGTKELEIILTDWLKEHGAGLTYEQLEQFDHEVLNIENPQMIRYLMAGEPLEDRHNNYFMRTLKKYVDLRKKGQLKGRMHQTDLKF